MLRDMYPGSAQAGLVLPRQLPLISTWFSFHYPTVELHPCLARGPRGCSVTTEGTAGMTLFQVAVTLNQICTQICRLSKRFSPKIWLLLSFSPAPPQPHPEQTNERTNNPQNKMKRETVRREQVQQRFSESSVIFLLQTVSLFSVYDSCGLKNLVYDSCFSAWLSQAKIGLQLR